VKGGWLDRALASMGVMRLSEHRRQMKASAAFDAANVTRLTLDWTTQLLTADQEARSSLTALRARSRELANNNDHAKRVVQLFRQNVIGPGGIVLQARIPDEGDLVSNVSVAEASNRELEAGWRRWGRLGVPTVDRRRTWLDVQWLAIGDLVIDGEVFLRKVRGFRGNDFGFALQFIEPDLVDVWLNRPRTETLTMSGRIVENEIRMGVEVDEWGGPVAYWLKPAPQRELGASLVGFNVGAPSSAHVRVDASELLHFYVPLRANSTRGIPWLHTAMTSLHQLGHYQLSELIAARMASCMMAFITSKTGDENPGGARRQNGDPAKPLIFDMEPGLVKQLAEGQGVETFNPNHPNAAFGEFVKSQLRAAAAGAGVSYSSLTGDLSEVNYSSIRQGLMDERDGYRTLQAFTVGHLCDPVFADWLEMAFLSQQLRLPRREADFYRDNVEWMPRGWQWVDPEKEVNAALKAIAGGLETHAGACAARGQDYRDIFRQRAKEQQEAQDLGLELQLSPNSNAAPQPQPQGGQQ
jgi:lambda family phage portal protein